MSCFTIHYLNLLLAIDLNRVAIVGSAQGIIFYPFGLRGNNLCGLQRWTNFNIHHR